MHTEDTICAISTPAGTGAIAMIRISGKNALSIGSSIIRLPDKKGVISKLPANSIHFGRIFQGSDLVDEIVAGIYKAPHSYTGEDIIEITCHGSVFIQQKILEIIVQHGARLANPGEFTQRAFLNGKMDLLQAEAVADLISSQSAGAHRLALSQMRGGFSGELQSLRQRLLHFVSLIELELDFSEEDVEFADRKQLSELTDTIESTLISLIRSFEYGNAMKQGIPVAIIGQTNSGKSTLLNLLLHEEKAIVSEVAGTTRDYIEDVFIIEGIQFRFIDTAGIRHTTDAIETEGIRRTLKKMEQASVVLLVIDLMEAPEKVQNDLANVLDSLNKQEQNTLIIVLNKKDLADETTMASRLRSYKKLWGETAFFVPMSAKTGEGIRELEKSLLAYARNKEGNDQQIVVTNVRHLEALKASYDAIKRVKEGITGGIPGDLLSQDIREVLHYLGEITGEITNDEILGNIFKNFCIGK